jgi:hypothetical protein
VIKYTSNAAAAAGESIRLRYTSSCGNSPARAMRLSNVVLNGCPITAKLNPTASVKPIDALLQVKVFPNPSRDAFQVKLETLDPQPIRLRIYDSKGIVVYHRQTGPGTIQQLGSNWTSGIYFMQVQQGKQFKTLRLVKE